MWQILKGPGASIFKVVIKIRVFFAIEFNDQVKQYLYGIQQQIMQHSLKGNFTHIENFHLTLKFIGEVEPEKITNLQKAVDETAVMHKCFDLNFGGIGCFSRGDKKIIWLGLERNIELKQLYQKLAEVLQKYGYSNDEDEYRPHITLGREVILKADLNKLKEVISIKPIKIIAESISLMESTRVDGKLTYVPLYIKKLAN